METNPRSGDAERNLANALFDRRAGDEAAEHAARAVQLQPEDPDAYDVLGRTLAVKGKLHEARSAFERAIQIDPNNTDARSDLARLAQLERTSTHSAAVR